MTDPIAYLVWVNLRQLAQNLASRYAKPFTASDAADWLTQPGREYRRPAGAHSGQIAREHSPFWRTDTANVFYSIEDPRAYLHPQEIDSVSPAKSLDMTRTRTAFVQLATVAA